MRKDIQPRTRWRHFVINIVSPVLVAITLFNLSIFMVFIPAIRKTIVEYRKQTLKELTLAISSQLSDLEKRVQKGLLSREEAQKQVLEQIENIRYGTEGKDYFWVTDLHPQMIMHPYRKDLNGKDVTHYSDPTGKELFSEFVRAVKSRGDAYVDYLWQWKDDSSRIVPKLSYVKLFEPWGWIIGTGVYLDDVREEVSLMSKMVIQISVAVSCVIALLLLYLAKQGYNLELRRMKAESALQESEKKYRLLVESTAEGIALVVDDHIVYANKTLLEMLGHMPQEIVRLTLLDILGPAQPQLELGQSPIIPDHARILRKDGRTIDVISTVSEVVFEGKKACIHTFKDISEHEKSEETLAQLLSELQTSLLMPNSPIGNFATAVVECGISTPIRKALEIMTAADSRAILVKTPDGEHVGIVTDSDLRKRLLSRRVDLEPPISAIMTAPLLKVSNKALLFEAALLFQEHGMQHLAVTNEEQRVVGMISTHAVLDSQRHPVSIILKNIHEARSPEGVIRSRQNLLSLVKALLDNGAKVESVTRILSSVSDGITVRLIELALEQIGPPPLSFSFVAFGSEAREEQTLRTDQDNGIFYADPEPDQEAAVNEYFLRLGALVCGWLNEAGYNFCKGEVMAKNPKWCQPVSKWLQYFSDCISAANPQDLLDVNVFFDFRSVYGEANFVSALRKHLGQLSKDKHVFFFHLAQTTLQYKPPLGFFGNIQLESTEDNSSAFNIKSAVIPIVNFARIYALKHDNEETGTLTRLQRLLAMGVLAKTSYDELSQAFSFLMQMRLSHQANQIGNGKNPDNYIDLRELTQIEQSLLRKIFSDILIFQARISRDFARTE
jgi:PAS domain S-box-containing protein